MSNSIWAMRLLNQLRGPTPALMPLGTGREEREERKVTYKKREDGSPPRRSRPREDSEERGRRKVKNKKRSRSPSSSSSEEISSSDYSSYDDAEVIKSRYKRDPCEYVSPAGLSDKKTKKEVVNYLEEKGCPKIETHAKRKHVPKVATPAPGPTPEPSGSPAGPSSSSPPPAKPGGSPTNTVVLPTAGPDAVEKRGKGRPRGPIRVKKPPTAYNLAVGRLMKEGKTMKEASGLAKEELAKKKDEGNH